VSSSLKVKATWRTTATKCRRLAIMVGLVTLGVAPAAATTCPGNVPVVTLAPHEEGGFSWGPVIRPMNDPCLTSIAVDPTSDSAWYVGGQNGLYVTKDGGQTWSHPLIGSLGALLLVPGVPQLVYAGLQNGAANRLYLSRDKGSNWTLIGTFKNPIMSVLAAGSRVYVGLGWSTHAEPSGVFVSNLGGGFSKFQAFGPGHTGLIVWTLARDPQDATLYAGTEIFDHPSPYHPPFFRSMDGGATWTNVTGTLPWHVIAAVVRPTDGFVHALTEGVGLFGSDNQGVTWQAPTIATGPSGSLLMDPKMPTRLFGGRQKIFNVNGGIFASVDAGKVFQPSGLQGVTVAGLAVNGTSTRLFATTYGSGIYVSPMPANSGAQ
jgi:photosystem II stability/assembly factor-like uncharacterized protein